MRTIYHLGASLWWFPKELVGELVASRHLPEVVPRGARDFKRVFLNEDLCPPTERLYSGTHSGV